MDAYPSSYEEPAIDDMKRTSGSAPCKPVHFAGVIGLDRRWGNEAPRQITLGVFQKGPVGFTPKAQEL